MKRRKEREAREKEEQARAPEDGSEGKGENKQGRTEEHREADRFEIRAQNLLMILRRWFVERACPQGPDDDVRDEQDQMAHRLWVERAPEPATIIWEGFGRSPRDLWLRRIGAGMLSFVLVIGTVAGFVVAHGYRGSAPIACNTAVCDERLAYPLLNQTASFARAVLSTSAEPGVASIGIACAHTELEDGEATEDDVMNSKVTKVVFRTGLTNNIGRPTCLGGYEFAKAG